eukprot:CAMPEP_0118905954 /NCGR_PEP_ID=MMETSP1166-20130328/9705_1 /TAXON_ID=1104430 /ORGANISM="Chrysoreinhardia sp, Strain CCMP3193" /LENGTH=563 /DNA_ID=CAMNT_0006845225 /DNA_START=278 /DNA_END=1968 /DNA_ORIENTATION=-
MDTTFSLRTTLGDVHLDADYSKKDVGSGFVCGDTGLNSQIRSSSCTMNGMTCSAKAWNETMDQRLGQMEALIQVQHQELLSIQDKIARIPDDLNLSCDQVSAREQSLTSAFLQDDEAEMMLSGVLCRLHDMYGDLCHRLDLEKHRVSSLATRLESKASIEVETEVKQQSTQLCHIQRFIDANWEVDLMDIRRKQDQLLSHLEERARVDESMIVTQSPSLTSLTELTSSPLGVFSFGSLQCPAESEDTRTLMARWCHDRQHVGLLALRAELLERMTNTMQLSLPTKPCRATTTVGASSDNPSQCGTSQREVRVTCLRRYQPQNYGKVLVLRCLKKLRKDLSKLNACHVDLVHLVGAVDYLDIATESAGVGLSIAPILDVNENRQMSSNSRDQHHEAKLIFADDLVKAQHIKENFRTKGNRHPAFDSQAQQPRKEKPAPPARREGSADRVSGLDSGFPLLHTPETQFEVSVRDASHATQFTSGTVLALAQRSSRSESIEERPPSSTLPLLSVNVSAIITQPINEEAGSSCGLQIIETCISNHNPVEVESPISKKCDTHPQLGYWE